MPTSTRKGGVYVSDPIDQSLLARSPVRQSLPLRQVAGWEVSAAETAAELQLTDLTPLAKVIARADPATVGSSLPEFGRARRVGEGRLLVGSGPDEWMVFGDAGTNAALVVELELQFAAATDLVSIIDVTHRGAVFRLSGEDANRVLEKICAIDLSDRASPDGTAFRSRVAGVECLVVRDDHDGGRAYLVHADRSYGQYLFDVLLDAGAEFSLAVAGYPEHL